MRNLYLRQDLNPILVAIMLSMFLKYHTSGFLCLLHGSPHGIHA